MKQAPPWQYDEFRHVGIDYDDPAAVAAYDARHAKFRDVDAECYGIFDALAVTKQSVVIELGAGTGAFAIFAARRCAKVYAVDVSKSMLAFAQKKADAAGLHEKELISDPKSKARSVVMTDEGQKKSEELFQKFFGK